MQIVLKFNLTGDKDDETLARRGKEFWSCLFELNKDVLSWIRHGHNFKSADDLLVEMRDRLVEMDLDCVE